MLLRNLCFTINNYSVEDIILISQCPLSYVIVGFEGRDATPHIQGYGELTKRTRFSTVKKYFPRAHIEARRGSAREAAEYCKKELFWIEHGEMSQQGARVDLDHIRAIALDGGMRAVTKVSNFQGIRVAEKFLTYNETPRAEKPTVVWLWGPTGSGKSRLARNICPDDVYVKNSATKWWDGYDGHEAVIIDDFRPSWWDLTYMLGILDRYEFTLEYKGGTRQLRATLIVVTSALAPDHCYVGTGEAVQQLLRRIDIIEQHVPFVPEVRGVILEPPDV